MSTSLWTKAERFEPRPIASPDALTRGLASLMDRLARAIRRRRTYAELAGLDDRALRDIGLDRGMLPGVSERTSSRALAAQEAARTKAWTWPCVLGGGAKLLSALTILVFEARRRAAARDLRRFEASLGPNQLKEFGQHSGDLPFQRLD